MCIDYKPLKNLDRPKIPLYVFVLALNPIELKARCSLV